MLICYNYYTGDLVWEREFPHDFSFSGFEIEDGILVGSCENKILYGIDARLGNILWTSEGAGTNSKLENRILNGIVYFGGGSSGFFHAVDIHSGKTIWKLDPYKYEDNKAFWTWSVNVVPGNDGEKGRVIIQNALHAYCFEAVK
jgi:outer membrane protein assembly factor BamB